MTAAIHCALHVLNEYANLLLVIVTIAYVWVTWLTVKALKETSLRETKARHLEEIKKSVIAPIVVWLEAEVERQLKGLVPGIIEARIIPVPKEAPQLGEYPFDQKFRIHEQLAEMQELSVPLYADARRTHFSDELESFEGIRDDVQNFAVDCAAFARECADSIALKTGLARGSLASSAGEMADSDSLVVDNIRCLMQGLRFSWVELKTPASEVLEVRGMTVGYDVARGGKWEVESWLYSSLDHIGKEWSSNGFAQRITKLHQRTFELRKALDTIMFTQSLSGDCALIGGTKKRWWRLLR